MKIRNIFLRKQEFSGSYEVLIQAKQIPSSDLAETPPGFTCIYLKSASTALRSNKAARLFTNQLDFYSVRSGAETMLGC
jgi:hypothetical protein